MHFCRMSRVAQMLAEQFGQTPTSHQLEAFRRLEHFLGAESGDECFVLKGYAGTGKTTLISALVKVLPRISLRSVLLAPTGRAA